MYSAVSSSAKHFLQRSIYPVATYPVRFFLLFWLLVNLLQASFTELTSDEGYYWFYAQHLQWGYYDHPPLVALLIKWGTAFLPGELGVRFFNVLLSTAALWLFFTLLPPPLKQRGKSYLVILSAPLLHYLTMLVFPDGPLLFASLWFLVLYRRFLQQKTLVTALLLGCSLALMSYSKYHGALVPAFTVMANPRLLRSGYFYLSLLVAALLFAPHLWWQYQHGFPTLQYHLSGRTGQWGLRHVGEYLSQQVVAVGPGLIFIPFIVRTRDVFERTLLFITIGTFGFFLVSSFKTFVHFHWTSVALFPLLYFAVGFYNQSQKKKLFRWLVVPFVVLFFIARLLLMVPLINAMHVGEDYYHGRKAWAKELAAVAGNRPVFMPNNLREASLYSFYSGKTGITLYNRPEKKSQYELWNYEDSLQGKEVLLATKYPFPNSRALPTATKQVIYYAVIPSFTSFYTGITLTAEFQEISGDDSATFLLQISNHRSKAIQFTKAGDSLPVLIYTIEKYNETVGAGSLQFCLPDNTIPPDSGIKKAVRMPLSGLSPGTYRVLFGIRNSVLPDAMLGETKVSIGQK